MTKFKQNILHFITLLTFLSACNKESLTPHDENISSKDNLEERYTLIQNPYTLANMTTAWANVRYKLSRNAMSNAIVNVRHTHSYI